MTLDLDAMVERAQTTLADTAAPHSPRWWAEARASARDVLALAEEARRLQARLLRSGEDFEALVDRTLSRATAEREAK